MRQIKKLTLKKVEIEQSAILKKKDMQNIMGGYVCWCCDFSSPNHYCDANMIEVPSGQNPSSYCPLDYTCAS